MADEERRGYLRRDEDRDLLVDHAARLGRLERDVAELSAHVDRELDGLDLVYPSRMEVQRDYVARSEHRQHSLDRRGRLMVGSAIVGMFLTPFLSAIAVRVLG